MTISPLDMIVLRLARLNKPKSKALPQHYYTGDPANHVRYEVEIARKEALARKRKADKQMKLNKKFRGK